MTRSHSLRAFSLLEVVIAVALFVMTVTTILALLPALSQRSSAVADRLAAQRLPDSVRLELKRIAATGLDSLAARVPVMEEVVPAGFPLVATRNGARVHSRDEPAPAAGGIAGEERYFLIECWRFQEEPLRYHDGGRLLVVGVQVTWPCPDSVFRDGASTQELWFVVTLNE